MVSLGENGTRRERRDSLGKNGDSCDEEHGEEDLESDGEPPREGGVDVRDSEIEPTAEGE